MNQMTFFERLEARLQVVANPLCPGLDPRLPDDTAPADIHARLVAHAERLLEATAEFALCFKPNLAFYEQYGAEGWRALKDIIAHLQTVAPVIADAKRGDIGSTASAYARAIFQELGADAITVSAGLGPDGLLPFLAYRDRGVFALLRTSNEGADLVQEQLLATGLPAWRAQLDWLEALRLNHPNLAYVVGATQPMALVETRRLAPTAWLLAPGVGAQGAEPGRTARIGFNINGAGLIVPVSRSIDAAEDPQAAARALAAAMPRPPATAPIEAPPTDDPGDVLVRQLVAAGCVRFGDFTLKSGLQSPVYLDLRRLVARPNTLALVAARFADILRGLDYDHVAALPYAALPIGTAIALNTTDSLIYPRREKKGYGTDVAIEGVFKPGDVAVIIDDVVTRGDAKLEALATLKAAGLAVRDMVVLVDREEGATALLAAHGTTLHAVMTLSDLATRAHRLQLITYSDMERTRAFIARPRDEGQRA